MNLPTHRKRGTCGCKRDMRSETVVQRLIQGDVGSGKTIVAFLAMADTRPQWLPVCNHGTDGGCLQEPTLWVYQSICEQFGLHIPIVLLTEFHDGKTEAYVHMRH